MASKILIGAPTQIGLGTFITVQVQKYENNVLIEDKQYCFDANTFTASYDNQQPNICILHFGNSHSITISNADYQEFEGSAGVVGTAIALASQVITDIATYTT